MTILAEVGRLTINAAFIAASAAYNVWCVSGTVGMILAPFN